MSLKMINQFNQEVFSCHVRAAKNFEENLSPQGPPGPLEVADPNSYTDEQFLKFMKKRNEGVNKQFELIAIEIAEMSMKVLNQDEALKLLNAARQCYEGEVLDEKTLKKCLDIFEGTKDFL